MKWLLFLIIYRVSNNKASGNGDFVGIVSDLLNDFNLDISFAPNTKSLVDNQYTNNFFIDESPASMFTFPSAFDNTFGYKRPEPLYLNMQLPESKRSTTFTLTNTNKVNGNTWRYTVNTLNTNGNNKQITQSWSTHKMYLCQTAACSNDNGIEMKNIFDNKYENYMHLIPKSTMGAFEDRDNDLSGLMEKAAKWWNNINKDTDYTDYTEEGESKVVGMDYIQSDGFMNNNNNRELEGNVNVTNPEKKDIFLMEMTAIIIFIMICGVFHAGWRFLLDRREKQREMDYYNMKGMTEL